MPEGPEVRKTADWLKSRVVGCVVRSVKAAGRFAKKPIARLEELKGHKCVGARCRGKVIVLDFEGELSAVSTLGMSGHWTSLPEKHIALTLGLELPPTRGILPVYFADQRHFGDFRVMSEREATSRLDKLGWDALQDPGGYGKVRIRALKYMKKATPVCEVMLDQEVFAGVGNYVRAEAMHRAKIDPWLEWRKLRCGDEARLCVSAADVMRESYSRGGATLATYYTGDGERGDHVDFLEVYGKAFDPRGNPVERKKDKFGRTVWYVPAVQK